MRRNRRTRAEWVTFGVAVAVLSGVAGLVVAEVPGGDGAAAPVARVRSVTEREGSFFVAVDVENRGGRTAESVQVVASLSVGGDEEESDQTIDFLAGGEIEEVEFAFDEDPAEGELTVRVGGYLHP